MKILGGFLLVLIFITIVLFFINPYAFRTSHRKTQTVIYRSKSNPKDRIEFQMNDVGALGYDRRIVRIKEGLIFDSNIEIDTSRIDKGEWIRVDEDVNELELKGG